MTVLAIPTYFHNWMQEKSGDGSIQIFDDGRATVNASAGSTAYLYTSAQLFPGETVEFSCNAYAATGEAMVSIQAFSEGSDIGDENEINAFSGGKNNKAISVKYTAPFKSNDCVLVYFKVGVQASKSGSMTAMCPRAQIKRGFIGSSRKNAAALISVNGGSVSINKSYFNTGIQEVNIVRGEIEVVMDKIVALSNATAKGIYPQIISKKRYSKSSMKLDIELSSYNSLSRRAYLKFVDKSTGLDVDASLVNATDFDFSSEII